MSLRDRGHNALLCKASTTRIVLPGSEAGRRTIQRVAGKCRKGLSNIVANRNFSPRQAVRGPPCRHGDEKTQTFFLGTFVHPSSGFQFFFRTNQFTILSPAVHLSKFLNQLTLCLLGVTLLPCNICSSMCTSHVKLTFIANCHSILVTATRPLSSVERHGSAATTNVSSAKT